MPKAEVHVPDVGHFALEEAADDIPSRMRGLLARLPRAAVKSPASPR
jgi:hypothetical protein